MIRLSHFQNIISSVIIATVGLSVCAISFVQEPASAYLFPRLISAVFAILSVYYSCKGFCGKLQHQQQSAGKGPRQHGSRTCRGLDLYLLCSRNPWFSTRPRESSFLPFTQFMIPHRTWNCATGENAFWQPPYLLR